MNRTMLAGLVAVAFYHTLALAQGSIQHWTVERDGHLRYWSDEQWRAYLETDDKLCSNALNSNYSGWNAKSGSAYVAEAVRRGFTVEACLQKSSDRYATAVGTQRSNDDDLDGADSGATTFVAVIFLIFVLFLIVGLSVRSLRKETQQRDAERRAAEAEARQREAEQQREAEAQRREAEQRRRDAEKHEEQKAPERSAEKPRQWWEVLGVSATATLEEITRHYRQSIRMYHPDRVSGLAPEIVRIAEQRTKELNAAYAQARRGRPTGN